MRTLVIDSATQACSVALFSDGECLAGEIRDLGRGHAEQLVPMIATLPDRGKATRIAVALGPGSFTGVRVGLAAARALAFVWDAALIGYPTLALVAAMARERIGPDQKRAGLAVVMTGGHGEWFVQRFGADGQSLAPLASLRPEAALTQLADQQCVAGSAAEALVALRGWGRALPILPDACAFPLLNPAALTVDAHPLYGRAPDARPAQAAAP
ncbi:MAG: tRNA (adenosine(37)-N6)-threonylcarbamoyltransferase complex dimerization subunit type 1 TsaB [Novosphingobium sp.]